MDLIRSKSCVPISEANAKALFTLAMMSASEEGCPSPIDLMEAGRALVKAGWNIDDARLCKEVMDSHTGGGLLHQVAWRAGSASIPIENACRLGRVLLACGANPNACSRGYRPVDMLVAGVHNGPDECAPLELFIELLLQHGLNHEEPGRYSLAEITQLLKKDGVPGNVVGLLEAGPAAVALAQSTPEPSLTRGRRSL